MNLFISILELVVMSFCYVQLLGSLILFDLLAHQRVNYEDGGEDREGVEITPSSSVHSSHSPTPSITNNMDEVLSSLSCSLHIYCPLYLTLLDVM